MSNLQNTGKNIFTIECEDIILREYMVEDLDDIHRITWEPEIYEFLLDWNVSKEQREDFLINYEIPENKQFLKAVSENGDIGHHYLRLGMISKETGKFIGWCCTGILDKLPPPNREIFYGISKEHSRKGYMTQAAKGLITYLFENTNVEELIAIAQVRNVPSNRVIQKCNFEFQNRIEIENKIFNYYKLRKN
ncbi:GNAT family N-acetyltransferase [Paenibacillus selenitireducens]|uniref:GNAT family N-acetyltransferase n=1 Tax=Paenibacillus selenitireducens TaxID=1324314 RepID=A0A1T2XFM9_9BACL|nr:GNAT family N-acetyltransferase [Paenibacillus selenitireducens]OPA78635.1 GNAT family N-acetyltransferase [Paenibacillus selenitireducens]